MIRFYAHTRGACLCACSTQSAIGFQAERTCTPYGVVACRQHRRKVREHLGRAFTLGLVYKRPGPWTLPIKSDAVAVLQWRGLCDGRKTTTTAGMRNYLFAHIPGGYPDSQSHVHRGREMSTAARYQARRGCLGESFHELVAHAALREHGHAARRDVQHFLCVLAHLSLGLQPELLSVVHVLLLGVRKPHYLGTGIAAKRTTVSTQKMSKSSSHESCWYETHTIIFIIVRYSTTLKAGERKEEETRKARQHVPNPPGSKSVNMPN